MRSDEIARELRLATERREVLEKYLIQHSNDACAECWELQDLKDKIFSLTCSLNFWRASEQNDEPRQ
jgi:hypothetical protein